MARRKNIQAGFLFLSWFLIFTHGILPHNHISEHISLPGFKHPPDLHCHHDDELSGIRQLTLDHETCSISNILFQKFNTDECFAGSSNSEYLDPFLTCHKLFAVTPVPFTGGPSASIVLLRAPPVAYI